MNKIVVEKINSSYAHVDADEDTLLDLNEFFKVFAEGYIHHPSYKMHGWDGKIAFFHPRSGLLPIGLAEAIKNFASKNGCTVEYVNFDSESQFEEKQYLEIVDSALKASGMKMRDYQDEACRLALQKKIGILECCTSSGKSMIIYNFIRNILSYENVNKVLLIVPNTLLVDQMYDDFKKYGWTDVEEYVDRFGGGHKPTFEKPVLLSTWQSLQSMDQDFFEDVNAVVVDEAHSAKAQVINKILKMCISADYRIGTTGTLPTEPSALMNITSVLGGVLYKISSKKLIDAGVLTKMIIANIKLIYPANVVKENKGNSYNEEIAMTEAYEDRTKALEFILNNIDKSHNVLILCNHIKHLKSTVEWIEKHYPSRKVLEISGSVSDKKRNAIRTSIEEEDGVVLVASYGTCSTGVNITKLHHVVLYSDSKSKIRVLQSLGRGLRAHSSKTRVILYDIVDDLTYKTRSGRLEKNYLYRHWEERNKYYKEQGFPRKTADLSL